MVPTISHVSNILGINLCMKYIGACSTIFSFYIENECLAFSLYLSDGCSRVWFTVPSVDETVWAPDGITKFQSENFQQSCRRHEADYDNRNINVRSIIFKTCRSDAKDH